MASPGFHDAPALVGKVKLLINAQLKSVLKKAGLPVSGVKAAMQERIIARKFHIRRPRANTDPCLMYLDVSEKLLLGTTQS